jgi:hypothetical protein
MRRLVAAVAVLLLGAPALSACGGGDSSANSDGTTPTKHIEVTFDGNDVTPNGVRIQVQVGQRIELDVTADTPGEIHVHSDPEQEFEYDAGSSTIELKPIKTPGVVEVESHTFDKVLFQLQVQ